MSYVMGLLIVVAGGALLFAARSNAQQVCPHCSAPIDVRISLWSNRLLLQKKE